MKIRQFKHLLCVSATYSTFYREYSGSRRGKFSGKNESLGNLKKRHDSKLLSKKSTNSMRDKIMWLFLLASPKKAWNYKTKKFFTYKLAMVTLTLAKSQFTSDEDIRRKMLNHFLITARRRWNVKHYVWRAEAQRNGNLHFHIIVDKFIHYKELRAVWNGIMKTNNYIDEKHEDSDPNSTDIHSLTNLAHVIYDVGKYMTKQRDGYRYVNGKQWACSESLQVIKKITVQVKDEFVAKVLEDCDKSNLLMKGLSYVQLIQMNAAELCKRYPKINNIVWNDIESKFYSMEN